MQEGDGSLAPATTALLYAIAASAPDVPKPPAPGIENFVRYASAASDPAEAAWVERAASNHTESRKGLMKAWADVRSFQRLSIGEVAGLARGNDGQSLSAAKYLEALRVRPSLLSGGVSQASLAGGEAARVAMASLAVARMALKAARPAAAALRSAAAEVLVEDEDRLHAHLVDDDSAVHLVFDYGDASVDRMVYVAAEIAGQRLRLANGLVSQGRMLLPIERADIGSGKLVVRLDRWPEGSDGPIVLFGWRIEDSAVAPFAQLLSTPRIESGRLSLDLRWTELPTRIDSGNIEVSISVGPGIWQLLGHFAYSASEPIASASFEYPAPDGPLSWPLRLIWRTSA
jgi:hypothetical protein